MTVDEAKAHFTKLAQDSGLDKDQTASVLQAMENEKFRGSLSQGYKRHEEYSRGLDEVRNEKERLKQWYEKEELPKYQLYSKSLDELRRYQTEFGDLGDDQGLNNGGDRNGGGNNNRRAGSGAAMTAEQFEKILEDRLKQRDSAYVGLTKSAVKISADYTKRFNDTLDVDAVEKIALERGLSLDIAYQEYIRPKEQVLMETRHKDEIEKAKLEAVRDYASRHRLPVDSKAQEAHPFFDRKTPATGAGAGDEDRNSRDEFMKGWNNYEAELTKT